MSAESRPAPRRARAPGAGGQPLELVVPSGVALGPGGPVSELEVDGVRYLSPEALVARWNYAVRLKTLKNWRGMSPPRGPAYVKIGRSSYYALPVVRAYEETVLGLGPRAVARAGAPLPASTGPGSSSSTN